jgi:hypothetical protein
VVVAAAAVLVAVGGASAVGGPTFSVIVSPHTLSAGSPAVAVGSFTNNGPAVDGVVLTFTFPFPVQVKSNKCATVPFLPKTVACLVGFVGAGQTASKSVQFTAPGSPGPVLVKGTAAFVTKAKPHAGLISASDTGTVFSATDPAHKGTCATSSEGSLSATLDAQTIGLPTLPTADPSLNLPCTPLGVSVDPRLSGFKLNVLSVELPQLQGGTTHVRLTFPDELLPKVPGNHDKHSPKNLLELTSLDPVTTVIVPMCSYGTFPAPQPGYSTDACIFGVTFNDPDGDNDAGTLDVLVQGSGFGDPRFSG